MNSLIRTVFSLLAVLVCIAPIGRAAADQPATHWPTISTEELHALRQSEAKFLLVDVLPKIIYDDAHIPGSINIPFESIRTAPNLPPDKDMLIVFYCMGVMCIYSGEAASAAREMGYRNLSIYREGIVGWQRAGLPVETVVRYPAVEVPMISARQLSDDADAFLLDVRPAVYFARGHIKGSANIALDALPEKLGLLPQNRRIVLIDHKGKLTLTTGRFLASKGFKNVARLDGGFNAWVKSGMPVEGGPGLIEPSECDRC